MAIFYSESLALSICQNIRSIMQLGGSLEIYGGTRPATPDTAPTNQPLLVVFGMPVPTFGAPSIDAANNRAVLPGNPVAVATAQNTGIATWGRLKDAGGAVVYDGNCGNNGSSAMFRLADTSLIAGTDISVNSHSFVQPKG